MTARLPCRRALPGSYWLPLLFVGGYVALLCRWHDHMREARIAGNDPFKATSWVTAGVASGVYIVSIFAIRRLMDGRQPFDCKPYMAVYNLYQVRRPCVWRVSFCDWVK
jgi:GNS1/SUR4 family